MGSEMCIRDSGLVDVVVDLVLVGVVGDGALSTALLAGISAKKSKQK